MRLIVKVTMRLKIARVTAIARVRVTVAVT